nr:reverse transcriptase domain-containing protein [Ferrimicrobium acidiphilum]
MKDRAIQALYKLALDPIAETLADPNSYGFRTARSSADAASQCFIALAKSNSAQWILEGDIKGCFDNISHDWMLANVPMDKVILRKWLKAGLMEKGRLFPTYAGTPQGSVKTPQTQSITGASKGVISHGNGVSHYDAFRSNEDLLDHAA